jgi:asparagine synthase (glutamine-hydrolysing)
MRNAMSYYGPHGGGSKIDGSLGMGHLLLEINPEDEFENQPMQGQKGWVTCSARLDNRASLLESFSVPSGEFTQTSDGALVRLAFDRWGREVPSHLRGDWSLAAWDRHERKLMLALNPYGNAALYYYEGKGYIAFASSLKALLALPGTVKEPDPLRLAQVLTSWQHDAERTAYKGFCRLVWAHTLTVGPDGKAHHQRYWSPEGREPLHYRRDEDYEAAFLEHYSRAVHSCLRTQKPVAMTLSGGRDSGSVASLAAPMLAAQGRELAAYTSIPVLSPDGAGNSKLGNEWEQADETALLAGANVRHIPIDAAEYGVLQGIHHLLDVHDGPSHAANNHFWLQAIYETVARSGAGVVLSGQMGNATVSWTGNGSALLALLQGDPASARDLFLHAEPNPWLTLKRQILKPLLLPPWLWVKRRNLSGKSPWREYSALNPQMADSIYIDKRMRAARYDATFSVSPLEDARLLFFRSNWSLGAGIYSELSGHHGMGLLDPTANLDLVEFLLRVPDSQFRRNGQGSSLIRRAFRDRLPSPVLEGRRKGLQAADVGHRILKELPAFRQCLDSLAVLPAAQEYLNLPQMNQSLQDLTTRVDAKTTSQACMILLRGLGVVLFLQRLG